MGFLGHLGQSWGTAVHSLCLGRQTAVLTNQLAHSFTDLLYPFTIPQPLGQAILGPGLSLALWGSAVYKPGIQAE